MYIFDVFSPSWLPQEEAPIFRFAPATNCYTWEKWFVRINLELEEPCWANKHCTSWILGQRCVRWSPVHNLHGNFTFFLLSFLPSPTWSLDLFAFPLPSLSFFLLFCPFVFPLDCWFPLGLEVWTSLISKDWEGVDTEGTTWPKEVDCIDNCCNWLSRLAAQLSIEPIIPSPWGPGLVLAKSNLEWGASGNFLLRTPNWE